MSTAAIVLAAGGGRRFLGTEHKLLTPYHGRPLVVAAIEAATAAGLDEVAVVSGAVDLSALCAQGVTVLVNPDWQRGLASSIQLALSWASQRALEAVVIGLGDAPGIPTSAWRAVAAAKAEVAVANFSGQRCPPVRLAASAWPLVPSEGDVGARALWQRPGTLEVDCEGDPSDVDTLQDLDVLEAASRGTAS